MAAPQIRIREVTGTMRVVDSESLLTPSILERIVAAVMAAMESEQRDREAHRRDTHIGGGCNACEEKHK
ncbi:hypothetical protein [Aromatoleum buckelii]|uniref:Uncharacterized protein n=1 Tax=Aromatoleum buckelii TaxID=200254 RepID=A0ABX1N4X8_9RHOO|nr:hypothetical protein [Aromatoleum buckelii]MCK0509723.1 hypothetical protein [Aromatoleum buckelii]